MSFEDDMIEAGFNNEMDYLDYLIDEDDERQEVISTRCETRDYSFHSDSKIVQATNEDLENLYYEYKKWHKSNTDEVSIFNFENSNCRIINKYSSSLLVWKEWIQNRRKEDKLIQSLLDVDLEKLKQLIRLDVVKEALLFFIDTRKLTTDEIIQKLLLIKDCKSSSPKFAEELSLIEIESQYERNEPLCDVKLFLDSLISHVEFVNTDYERNHWNPLIDKLDGIDIEDLDRLYNWCDNNHYGDWDKLASKSSLSNVWNHCVDMAYNLAYTRFSWNKSIRHCKGLWFEHEYKNNFKEFERRALIEKLTKMRYKGGRLFNDGLSIYMDIDDYYNVIPCCGFINELGNVVIEQVYDDAKPMLKNYAWVKSGTESYREYLAEIDDYIYLPRGGLWGLINKDQDQIVSPKYHYLQDPIGDYYIYGISVGKSCKYDKESIPYLRYGIVKYNGEETTPAIYDKLVILNNATLKAFRLEDNFSEANSISSNVGHIGKWALVSNEGQQLTDFIYDDITCINCWSYIVRVGGIYDEDSSEYINALWGVINCIGEEIIPFALYESFQDLWDYLDSEFSNIDYSKWLILAANLGIVAAEYKLGCSYLEGDIVSQSFDKAIEYLEKASIKGELAAQYKLSLYYFEKQHYEDAVKYLQTLVEYEYCDSMYYLGLCYFYGKGISKSYELAVRYFTSLANRGYGYKRTRGYKKAIYMLGVCYAEGKGVNKSYDEAIKCFLRLRDL